MSFVQWPSFIMHDLWGRRKLYVLCVMNPLDFNEPVNMYFGIRTPVMKQLIILENAVVGKKLALETHRKNRISSCKES